MGKHALLGEIRKVEKCCEDYSAAIGDIIEKLTSHREKVVGRLVELKDRLKTEAEIAFKEVEETLMEDKPVFKSRFGDALRNFEPGKLPLFECTIETGELVKAIPGVIKFEYSFPGGECEETPQEPEARKKLWEGEGPTLPAIQTDKIAFFDFAQKTLTEPLYLLREIRCVKHFSFVLIDHHQLICCGGTLHTGLSANVSPCESVFSIEADGVVNQLADMLYARYLHGVVYCAHAQSVYVFGGNRGTGSSVTETTTCEQMRLMDDSGQWESIPSMSVGRKRFNPCEYLQLVYLCGSPSDRIDVYDPMHSTMVQIAARLPESPSSCSVFVSNNCLTVISDSQISKFTIEDGTLRETSTKSHKKLSLIPSSSPLLVDSIVYVVCDYSCHWFDPESGDKLGSTST